MTKMQLSVADDLKNLTCTHVARRAQRLAGFMLLALCVLVFSRTVFAAVKVLQVQADGQYLSVEADGVQTRDLLKEISMHTGMKIVSNLPLDESISINVRKRPLPKVIGRIFRDQNYILQSQAQGEATLYTLWVIAEGTSRTDLEANATLIIDSSGSTGMGLDDDNPNVRLDAVMDLADEQSSAALAQAISDPEPEIREAAIFALAEVGDETSMHLIRQALSDSDEVVRQAAEEMLMELDDK